ncbi:MAG: hypothetical protein IJI35_09675, partial [Kiritimatiellae bacterium]|nr:hypothetical protein [Kiritimatiellia bacterium]
MVRDMPHPAHPFLARVTGDRDAKEDAEKYADAEMVVKKVKVVNRDAADESEGAEDTVAFKADKFGPYAIMQLVDAEATQAGLGDSAVDTDSDDSNDTAADKADAASDGRPKYDGPAASFEQELSTGRDGVSLKVTAEVPEGALPKGATMRAELVEDEAVIDAAKEAAADEAGIAPKRAEALAADITFLDADGNPIEPAGDVRVTMTSPVIAEQDSLAIVHVDDAANAQVVSGEEVSKRAKTVTFDAAEFSVYALVYTVDFHWEV